MEEIFDPVVEDVLRLVSQQVKEISRTKAKRITVRSTLRPHNHQNIDIPQSIVLVGGFRNSDYLKRELDVWCATNGGIKCIRPDFW
jgi:hypothetical protein